MTPFPAASAVTGIFILFGSRHQANRSAVAKEGRESYDHEQVAISAALLGRQVRRSGRGLTSGAAGIAAVAAVALAGCGGSGGRPDEELGGLVVTRPQVTVDLDRAADDAEALRAALTLPYHERVGKLGAHRFRGVSELSVSEAGTVIESLADRTSIDFAADGDYHATLDNSRDYGRHVYHVDGLLYLRPRYGKYHRRAPTEDAEPGRIASEVFATLGAYYEPLAAQAKVTDGGRIDHHGRPARRIELSRAARARAVKETAPERAWRAELVVDAIAGEVVIDQTSGLALFGRLTGTATWVRDGRTFTLALRVEHDVTDIGATVAIVPPAAEQVVDTPVRSRELEERAQLLDGIAAPATPAAPRAAPGTPGASGASSTAGKTAP
jgi:hypothetical protein